MVRLHVKKGDESQFLYDTTVDTLVDDVIQEITVIYNGRLKINRIAYEMEELAKHGTMLPSNMMGLTDEQVIELKLKDEWADKCSPMGGWTFNKDVMALDLLRGASMIVYPMGLPPHDVIRKEFENTEDLTGTQASLEVMDVQMTQLWFSGKEMIRGKKLKDYLGANEKTKIVVKLQKRGSGMPAREPLMNDDERKEFMMHAYRRQEQLKKLPKESNFYTIKNKFNF
ncbi:Similar to cfap298: Cilia- and flagella-associated protein 298 (Danio rerio) [Cotesia congregata]|uniref:Similar to cfap298: Cilia- and flagella-associated protein 298 (Danio rerio) n=1 Tax=Cotesia congregata TaxID=51543 RepID=A0A8J2HDA8_COTCN|nr:Similar to cfap298: Cilia- and flagella-associated protein 298 (Danio rerio) [Cotesia congregata]